MTSGWQIELPRSIASNGSSTDRCQPESNSNPRHCLQTKTFAIGVTHGRATGRPKKYRASQRAGAVIEQHL